MDKQTLAKRIYETANLTGSFNLGSGTVSHKYFDKYQFEADPVLLAALAQEMRALLPDGTEVLAGLEMGGIPLCAALSLAIGLPSAYIRKAAKAYGAYKLSEGAPVLDRQLCIIEDVVTTGGRIIESVQELRKLGAKVNTVICAVLRDDNAIDRLAEQDIHLLPVFTMRYLQESAE